MVNGGYPFGPDEVGDAFGPAGPAARLWQVFWFIFVFVLLWPPMIAMVAVPLILGVGMPADAADAVVSFLRLLFGAWVVGAVPAALTGAALGFKDVYFGGAGWLSALAIGAGAAFSCLLLLVVGLSIDEYWSVELEFCLVATLASLVCHWIVKTWFRERPRGSRIRT
ncbi:MAG TPA: hypothetical protein VMG39_14010 [Pseudolabrys sp.]|nr:hypothetical protein [Pseudolabrys sp.]